MAGTKQNIFEVVGLAVCCSSVAMDFEAEGGQYGELYIIIRWSSMLLLTGKHP